MLLLHTIVFVIFGLCQLKLPAVHHAPQYHQTKHITMTGQQQVKRREPISFRLFYKSTRVTDHKTSIDHEKCCYKHKRHSLGRLSIFLALIFKRKEKKKRISTDIHSTVDFGFKCHEIVLPLIRKYADTLVPSDGLQSLIYWSNHIFLYRMPLFPSPYQKYSANQFSHAIPSILLTPHSEPVRQYIHYLVI